MRINKSITTITLFRGAGIFIIMTVSFMMSLIFKSYAYEVRYEELRDIITENNPSVKTNSYYDNLEELQEQLEVLKQECSDMVALSKLSDSTEDTAQYKNSASNFNQAIEQLEKQLAKQTGSGASINDTIDSLTISAQTSMVNYLLMELNAEASQKKYDAASLKYDSTAARLSAGMATDTDVVTAHAAMLNARTQYENSRQQAEALRRSLLQLLGLADDGSVEICPLSEPDLDSIAAMNYDADLIKAVNNDSGVQNVRHTDSSSSADMALKAASEDEAVGNAISDFNSTYTLVMTRLEEYNGAKAGMASAEAIFQGMERKRSAGMLTEADYLTAEADYITSSYSCRSAMMNLVLAYDNYCWMLSGDV